MTFSPKETVSKTYMSSPGYKCRRVSFYNSPGTYTWSKTKDSSNMSLPGSVMIEVCSGGGGAASGIIIVSDSLDKKSAVGASGGGAAVPIAKTFNVNELVDNITITVGDGGRGGLVKLKGSNTGTVSGNNGTDGGISSVGPYNIKNDILFSKEGKKSKYVNIDNIISSEGGDELSGYCSKYVSNEARADSLDHHHGTFGGSSGSNFELTLTGSYEYKEAGQSNYGKEFGGKSIALPSGKYLGRNGSNALKYGSGGNGGGITLITGLDSSATISSKGGDGGAGYVKITTIFGIDSNIG